MAFNELFTSTIWVLNIMYRINLTRDGYPKKNILAWRFPLKWSCALKVKLPFRDEASLWKWSHPLKSNLFGEERPLTCEMNRSDTHQMQASQWAMRAKVAMRRRRTAAPYSEYLSIFLATLTRRRSRAVFRRPMRVVVCRLGRNHCKARRRHDKALLYSFHWDMDSPWHETFPIMVGEKKTNTCQFWGESWKYP